MDRVPWWLKRLGRQLHAWIRPWKVATVGENFSIMFTVMLAVVFWPALFTAPFDAAFGPLWFPPVGLVVVTIIGAFATLAIYGAPSLPFGPWLPQLFAINLAYGLWHTFFCGIMGRPLRLCASDFGLLVVVGSAASLLTYLCLALRVRFRQPAQT